MVATDPLAGKRIAVTGASGFVGSRLVRALVARGARVHGYGRRHDGPVTDAGYTRWDIAATPLPAAPSVDAVVHCAGMVTEWGSRREFFDCHVRGTKHVLASFPEPCPVVTISTASVYDPFAPKALVSEDARFGARYLNAYSESKACGEPLVRARRNHVVLRPHAIYGRGDNVLLPRILDAYRGGRLLAAGDGSNRVSLTHVDNLVDALLLAIEHLLAQRASGCFNIADEEPVVMDDVLRAVLKATGREPRVAYLPRALAWALGASLEVAFAVLRFERSPRLTRYRVMQVADEYTLDLARAKSVLGYRPSRDVFSFLAEGGERQAGQRSDLS